MKAPHSAICHQKNFPREYFLAADRGDVYLIRGHKNLKSFIEFASHSNVVHSEDHFSEEGLFRSLFAKSSFKFKRKWKVRVPSHTYVSFLATFHLTDFRKVKTIRYGLHILINKHLQYQCLEFTILKRT